MIAGTAHLFCFPRTCSNRSWKVAGVIDDDDDGDGNGAMGIVEVNK